MIELIELSGFGLHKSLVCLIAVLFIPGSIKSKSFTLASVCILILSVCKREVVTFNLRSTPKSLPTQNFSSIIVPGRNCWWWLQPYLQHIKSGRKGNCDHFYFPFLDCDMEHYLVFIWFSWFTHNGISASSTITNL